MNVKSTGQTPSEMHEADRWTHLTSDERQRLLNQVCESLQSLSGEVSDDTIDSLVEVAIDELTQIRFRTRFSERSSYEESRGRTDRRGRR